MSCRCGPCGPIHGWGPTDAFRNLGRRGDARDFQAQEALPRGRGLAPIARGHGLGPGNPWHAGPGVPARKVEKVANEMRSADLFAGLCPPPAARCHSHAAPRSGGGPFDGTCCRCCLPVLRRWEGRRFGARRHRELPVPARPPAQAQAVRAFGHAPGHLRRPEGPVHGRRDSRRRLLVTSRCPPRPCRP